MTVVAADAVDAEVAAKSLFLAGSERATAEADATATPAVLVTEDGEPCSSEASHDHDPTFWLLARASGLTAYVLLTLSVLAGLVLKSRPFGRALRAAAITDVHRFLALVGLGMLGLHAASARGRRPPSISRPTALIVRASRRTGRSRRRLRRGGRGADGADRRIVPSSAPAHRHAQLAAPALGELPWVFALGTLHGLTAGTDSSRPWVLGLYLGAVGAVAYATAWRAFNRPVRPSTKGGNHVPNSDRPLTV